jgi:hypothetical protein
MTEEPYGKTSIGTVETRCARGKAGWEGLPLLGLASQFLGPHLPGGGWRMPPTQERVIITAAVALDWFGATRG